MGKFSAGTNVNCASWTDCGPGTEPTNAPGASVDRSCSACDPGTFTAGTNQSCTAWTDCSAGTEPTNTPSAQENRTCAPCPAETFSSEENTQCQAWRDCVPGEEVNDEGTATQNRRCRACANGTFSTMNNASECEELTDCGFEFPNVAGTSSEDRTCCPVGFAGSACSADISGYALVYGLEIPSGGEYNTAASIPWNIDATTTISSFSRIAYVLELDGTYVWVEMDDFTSGDVSRVGIPADWIFDTAVSNLSILSNASNLLEIVNGSLGSVEFWPNNYSPGLNGVFDFDDDVGPTDDGFGSMQIHYGNDTLFAFNRWSVDSANDVGIGTRPSGTLGSPDWTDARNAAQFVQRRLRVYVLPD
ncbi:MAG: hypothetical protein AAFX94_15310 [Myxococcota bacterium]